MIPITGIDATVKYLLITSNEVVVPARLALKTAAAGLYIKDSL
jgi:hypothetical protein